MSCGFIASQTFEITENEWFSVSWREFAQFFVEYDQKLSAGDLVEGRNGFRDGGSTFT